MAKTTPFQAAQLYAGVSGTIDHGDYIVSLIDLDGDLIPLKDAKDDVLYAGVFCNNPRDAYYETVLFCSGVVLVCPESGPKEPIVDLANSVYGIMRYKDFQTYFDEIKGKRKGVIDD